MGNHNLNCTTMTKVHPGILIVLIILNAIVLIGQLWPAGAPPFARTVNIVFLGMSLLFFLSFFIGRKTS